MAFFRRGKKTEQPPAPSIDSAQDTDSNPPPTGQLRPLPAQLEGFELVTERGDNPVVEEEITRLVSIVRRPHPLLNRLSRGLNEPEELLEVVCADPDLAVRVLRTVNSAAFALTSPITSLQHAINYLGITLVKDLVTRSVITDAMDIDGPEHREACTTLWSSAYVASTLVTAMAKELRLEHGSEISTQALLTSIGDLAILSSYPEYSAMYLDHASLLERVDFQQQNLGANSALLGSRLASSWELPEQIVQGLKTSLLPMSLTPEEYRLQVTDPERELLCYLACRVGDLVAVNGVKDIGSIDLEPVDNPELFYLPRHLEAAGLSEVSKLLSHPGVRKRMNAFIQKVI